MKYKYIFIGSLSFLFFLLMFGIPTAIIPNQFYTRMIPATYLDRSFLIVISVMLGVYAGMYSYGKSIKKKDSKEDAIAGGSAIASFFALSCPICIGFLVAIFGTAALLTYFEPVRPILGIIVVGILCIALYLKISSAKRGCERCI